MPNNHPDAKKLVTEDCIKPEASGVDKQSAVNVMK